MKPIYVYGGVAIVVLIGAYLLKKKLSDVVDSVTESVSDFIDNPAEKTAAAVGAVAGVADGVASGAVLGVGDAIGVPRTSLSKCENAKRLGSTWDASKYCSAGDFLGYLWE